METSELRLPQVKEAPQSVARHIQPGDLTRFWDMAKIGMNNLSAWRLTFDNRQKLMAQTPVDDLDAALAEAKGDGYLLQGEGAAGLYVPADGGDLLLVAANAVCRSEDCHCG